MKTVKEDRNVQNAEGDQAVFTKVFSTEVIIATLIYDTIRGVLV